ncbi:spore cortex biosynthesis protein YabQ [Paenibacillus gansuensis]|uniref:Spore cortex biosynthesis protein YabQ n=1 Tax=Paenibacillus gansuensis TaxID=306542 RepID=A0ABW5P8E4_9BACL
MSLHTQFYTFAMMALSGVLLGVVYDAYRVVCRELRLPRWVLSLMDLVYWVFSCIFVFRVLYASNQGEIRLFVFLGLVLGVLFYFWLIGSITVRIVLWLIQVVRALLRFGAKCFRILILMPLRALYKLIVILLGFLAAITIFVYKIVLQLIGPVFRLIWRILQPLHKYWVLPSWFHKFRIWLQGKWKRPF